MARGTGKPCGASYISHNKVCRVSLPSAVNEALNKASHQVGIAELVAAAKHLGDRGAQRKANIIRRQLRAEVLPEGGNLKKGEHGQELKRRLEAAGLLPQKGATKSENAGDIFNKNVKPKEEDKGKSVPPSIKKQLAALAARDHQLENPKALAPAAKPDSVYGTYATSDLNNARDFLSIMKERPDLLKRVNAELARRAGAPVETVKAKAAQPTPKMASKIPTGSASSDTHWAKQDAADFDKSFKPASRQGGTYDWNETIKPGTKKIGEGGFGTVLMTKGPPPVAVKRGEVSEHEAEIIDKVGKADLGPKLIAGEASKGGRTEYGVLMKQGRIAMSVVPGEELMDMMANTRVGNTTAGDAYWAARAALHRMGIAHNDMHPGNLLIDKTGKGRWVDMGLAHDSPRAALAEALGVLRRPRGSVSVGKGDWQGQKWESQTGNDGTRATSSAPENLKRMQSNHETKVLPFLRSKGLDNDEIGEVMTLGLRVKPSQYTTGGFAKLSNSDALQAINLLYDGI